MKKNKDVRFRHKLIITIARPFIAFFYKIKYKYSYKYYKNLKNKGPFLLLGNHTISSDPLLMGFSFPFHIYHIATEQIFNLGFLSKLLVYAVNPIKKSKALNDITAIRKAKKIVNEGGSVGVYPEGNLTYDGQSLRFEKSIVKLIRFLKIPVVIFVTEGLYFSNPRWSLYNKKGKSKGYVKVIINPDEYLNMSDDELYEFVYDNLYINAYDNVNNQTFKGKNMAHGLERLIFMDLETGKPFVTSTKGNMLTSSDSNFSLKYLETGYLIDNNDNSHNLIDLNNKIIESYYNYYKNNEVFLNTPIVARKTTTKKRTTFKHASLTLNSDKFVLKIKDAITNFEFSNIEAISIQGKKKIIVYANKETWLFTLPLNISPYAFLLTYQFYKKGESLYEDDFSVFHFGL